MNITKATRWRVFAGVWLQSLFTSATAYFSLFCIPLTTKFDGAIPHSHWHIPFICLHTVQLALSAVP